MDFCPKINMSQEPCTLLMVTLPDKRRYYQGTSSLLSESKLFFFEMT